MSATTASPDAAKAAGQLPIPGTETAKPADGAQDKSTITKEAAPAKGTLLGGGVEGEKPKEGDPAKADKPADGEIVLKFPEGFTPDKAMTDAFLPVAKKIGLDSEKASELAGWYIQQSQQASEAAAKVAADAEGKRDSAWEAEIRADREVGGDKFEKSRAMAFQAVRLVDPSGKLAKDLTDAGVGNLPSLFKAFAKLRPLLGEDNSTTNTSGAGAKQQPVDSDKAWQDFYANPTNKKAG